MPRQKSENRLRAKRIHDIASNDPRRALDHLSELQDLLLDPDAGNRNLATLALVRMSTQHQADLRRNIPTLLSRLDDVSVNVRVNALIVLYNLGHWFPQDMMTASDLIVVSVGSENEKERAVAVGLLSKIANTRPDLVTPREGAIEALENFDIDSLSEGHLRSFATEEAINDAITSLRGGDMASTPLNADLAMTPLSTRFSKPASIAFHSLFVGLFLIALPILAVINVVRFGYRYRRYPASLTLRIALGEVKKLKLLINSRRAKLYFRSSMFPAPVQVFRFLPGKAPIPEDHTVETGDYPENWGIISRVVYERDGYRCRNCGCGGGPVGDNELHADHQVPRSQGGADYPHNLRTLCRGCHQARHARMF